MTSLKSQDTGAPLRRSETCEEQLRRMCKNVAEEITEGKSTRLSDYDSKCEVILEADHFMKGVYSIEWICNQDKSYKAARLMVAGGGPNIWVNLQTNTVDGYWASDKCSWGFVDNIGLDDHMREIYDND